MITRKTLSLKHYGYQLSFTVVLKVSASIIIEGKIPPLKAYKIAPTLSAENSKNSK